LDAAHSGNIPNDLTVDRQYILDLLDGRVSSNNPDNEVFRILLVSVCNQLHSIFPFLFEKIDNYTELLLPDDLTSPFSIVKEIVEGMADSDCAEVEIIGWLYQFYISEKKDEVFASKSAVKKEDIPAATQLFTPRWIVEYMVQNTVGKLWLQNKPNSRLKDHMPYFIDSPSLHADDYLKVNSVEEIKLLDQACGSGHILVYGFDLFFKIYEEEGYNPNEIPSLILKNNLFGFEIDERAAQLAGFALLMKSRSYYRRFFRNPIEPNILCYQDLLLSSEEIKETFIQLGYKIPDELNYDLHTMQQATNFGSLIAPNTSINELQKVKSLIDTKINSGDAFLQYRLEQIKTAINQLIQLCNKYHCVVDNPPYMGGGNMNKILGDFVKTKYPDSKADLMACFMEAGLHTLHPMGYLGMINQHSWMFLSSYEKLRAKLIDNVLFDTNLHLGARTFPEIGGEVVQNTAFTFWNKHQDSRGTYIRLVDFNSTGEKREKTFEAIQNPNKGLFYTANQKDFGRIPGSPIGYWISKNFTETFSNSVQSSQIFRIEEGLKTGLNERFIKMWFELPEGKTQIKNGIYNWKSHTKGGDYRKWFGNELYKLNYSKELIDFKGSSVPKIQLNDEYVSWGRISAANISFRYTSKDFIPNMAGLSAYSKDNIKSDLLFLCSLGNSKVGQSFLNLLNPTLNYPPGVINKIPIKGLEKIDSNLVLICIDISKNEWDQKELSEGFTKNELLKQFAPLIAESYELYQQYWCKKFFQLHKNEEELNRSFIEIYGLQEELTPDVPLEEITILKEETSIENGELIFHANEVFSQFVSYSVGCMFGRYSLDKEGLILANQGETLKEYLIKVAKNKEELSFMPDEDNVIPVLDDEWFEDDIVARFHSFLKASFGEKEFQKNLAFVEECLGKDIRKYLIKDFYKDHIKRYKKRPIYWMFSSPKGSFNVLIYMHRYTPDTLSSILNGYLREFMGKVQVYRNQQEHNLLNGSSIEQNKARKEMDKLDLILAECRQYEADILYPLAGERIAIDLDDGVLVNYNKFGLAIAQIDGLNDKKTKKKVLEFDWIDTTQIR
jgi:hypothetical protein